MFMKLLLSMAMIVVCLSARAEESAEAGKARIDMRFNEGGGEGAPKDSGAVHAGEGRKHNLKLAQVEAKRTQALEVPAPGVISGRSSTAKEVPAASSAWGKWKTGGAIGGGVAGAVVGLPATTVGFPIAVGILIAGTLIAAGAAIGYGIVALAERVAEKTRRAVSSGALDQ